MGNQACGPVEFSVASPSQLSRKGVCLTTAKELFEMTSSVKSFEGKGKLAWCIAIVVVYIVGMGFEPPKGLSVFGWQAIILIVCATMAWVSEFVPIGISSCFLLFLPNILGLEKTGAVMTNFATPTVFFIMSALVIARVFVDTGFGNRVALYMTSVFGNRSRMVLLGLMTCCGFISMVLADIHSAIIIGGIALTILQKNDLKPGSNFGRSVMVGIPIAAAVGGIATPAGSGVNILSINLLKSVAGIEISFFEWTIIGMPMAIVLIFVSWVIVSLVYKPEIDIVKGMDNIEQQKKELGPLSASEKKFAVIFAGVLALWFTQSKTGIELPFTSMAACVLFFMPGIKLMDWKRANQAIAWDTLMLVGSCNALAMLLASKGSAKWLSDTFLGGFANSELFILVSVVTIFGVFIHLLVPISGAVMAMCIPIIFALSQTANVNAIYLVLPLAYTASCVFLIPLDPTCLTTYGYGYWKMKDMSLPGFIVALVWIPLLIGLMMLGIKLGFV